MIEQNAALERLRPSEKADHKTVLEEQGLKREVCTDGTRVKILEGITKWANDCSLASPHVFWLTGQAGSGKTTIAYTIAKRFESIEEDGNANHHTVLGGNFLCSRQFQETQSQTRIVLTIAYQLALKCESYANCQRTPQSTSHYSRHLRQSPIHPSTQTTKSDLRVRPTCPTYVSDLRVQPTCPTYVSGLRG